MKLNIDFVKGNTKKSLIKMFVPLLMAMTLTMIYSMVDSLWVGNLLGEHGLSALTAGTAIVLIMSSLSMGTGNGISVMIAKMVGAKDKKAIGRSCATVILVSAFISIIGCGIMEFLVTPVLKLMGTPSVILGEASMYLKIYLIGNVALFIYMQFTSIFRAFGDSVFQMIGMIIPAVINAIADPFMIRVYGLKGAAIATVISEVLCLVFAVLYHMKKRYFSFDFGGMEIKHVVTMMRFCIPTSVQAVMPALSSAVMISFISPFGTEAMAGFGVARNLEYLMFMPTTAMCMAVTSIVGQCSGAGRCDRAKDYLKSAVLAGAGLIAVISLMVVIFSGNLTAVFGQGAEIAAVVKQYFRILSIGFVLYMITSCLQGFLTGIGKPEKSMLIIIVYYIIVRIPAAMILKNIFGLSGVWMAFLVSHIVSAIFGLIIYKLNTIEKTFVDMKYSEV